MQQPFQMTVEAALVQVAIMVIFVVIGYLASRPLPAPENPVLWLLLVAGVIVIGFFPIWRETIFILGAPFQLNNLLWYVGGGVLIGLMFKRGRSKA